MGWQCLQDGTLHLTLRSLRLERALTTLNWNLGDDSYLIHGRGCWWTAWVASHPLVGLHGLLLLLCAWTAFFTTAWSAVSPAPRPTHLVASTEAAQSIPLVIPCPLVSHQPPCISAPCNGLLPV